MILLWIALLLFAAALAALSLLNASWIAPTPSGRLILIAHRGTAQPVDRAAGGPACTARRIRPIARAAWRSTSSPAPSAMR